MGATKISRGVNQIEGKLILLKTALRIQDRLTGKGIAVIREITKREAKRNY